MEVGVSLIPNAEDHDKLIELARAAERAGLDMIGIQDHPYQRKFLDTFLLIADLLARTERIAFFPDVANLPLRDPAMLAKQAASLSLMSGGRFELGLGAGALWDRVATMGGPRRTPGEAVEALEEAMRIIRAGLDGQQTVDFDGRYYQLSGWEPGPAPAHRVGIWLGAYKPRMLRLTGRLADGWIPSLGRMEPDAMAEARKAIDAAAEKAGRNPADVLTLCNVSGELTDGERGDGLLDGPAGHWIETLSGLIERLGIGAIILPAQSVEQVERLVAEVAPGLRKADG
jgi:alkanesulfonate monooxygenase SsuD/methylene tetrahydromethanopterin reductase-like flavin-dependent oxidoreductase (luciferase family)